MRVLFISKYAVSPEFGDPTRQFFYCKYLSRQPDTSVLLVSSRSSTCNLLAPFRGRYVERHYDRLSHWVLNGPAISLGLNWKRVWSWFWFEIQILRNLGRLKKWKPDVIIVSSLSIFTFLTGIILKLLFRRPLIIEVRDVYPETLQSLGNFSRFHPAIVILRKIEKMAYRHADAIVSSLPNLSPHVRQVLGFDKPVTYLPMGIDPEFYSEQTVSENARNTIEKLESLGDAFLAAT